MFMHHFQFWWLITMFEEAHHISERYILAFKRRPAETALPSNPEQLYPSRNTDPSAPEALWLHQGDVIRTWHSQYATVRDVAIELPTGAGKTLVGGLIGEFQRQTAGQRVAYLCPNKQLAKQSYEKLVNYGIPAVLLVGRSATWNRADRARYSSADAIAVSVYSHVFNSNPAIADSEYMILDDAHAAEGNVAGPWSIEITRDQGAYADVLAVLESAFDPLVLARLRQETPKGQYSADVYLASPIGVASAAEELQRVLTTAVATHRVDSDAGYALQLMEGHLGRCLIYASYRRLLIRPFIAPTHVHTAFEAPRQRLYMSATLGEGGELERSFGRRKINRIPSPSGWDKKGTGRRFFCFPELTTDISRKPGELHGWISDVVKTAERAVVLTPDRRSLQDFEETLDPAITRIHAAEVEEDLKPFTAQTNAALVLANRYDGIDLPDDDCRVVILDGLPARGDLQERFLVGSLGAMEVLQERIRARVVQGAGRATRNSNDFAAVVMLGDDLTSFCLRKEVLAAMRPEVNAEISFGYENSLGVTAQDVRENLDAFLAQSREWKDAEIDIEATRDKTKQVNPPGTDQLGSSAAHEVEAYQALWHGEFDRALELAKRAIDSLSGGRAPQRYAAFWNYLAASWSWILAEKNSDVSMRETSNQYFRAARASGRGTLWLSHLASPSEENFQSLTTADADPIDEAAAQSILSQLPQVGKPSVFDSDVTRIRSQLMATAATPYEEALVYLGRLAGASDSYGNGGATAAPDAAWIFGSRLWVTWEAKSEAQPSGELGAEDVRQTGSHLRYVLDQRNEPIPSGSISIIMTPQERIHPTAHAVAEGHTHLVRGDLVLDLFDRLVRAWRNLRTRGAHALTTQDVLSVLHTEGVLPSMWVPQAMAYPLSRTDTSSD